MNKKNVAKKNAAKTAEKNLTAEKKDATLSEQLAGMSIPEVEVPATAEIEIPASCSAKKEEKKEEVFEKKTVALDAERAGMYHFERIKSRIAKEDSFDAAIEFLRYHLKETVAVDVPMSAVDRICKIQFPEKELFDYTKNNKSIEGTQTYTEILQILKSEIPNFDNVASHIAYAAISFGKCAMRKKIGKRCIENDIQCVPMLSAEYFAANDADCNFIDKGNRVVVAGREVPKISTFRMLKGMRYTKKV